ncbi:hypothetical protein CK203_083333 [Vitis vinifera]|uniref:Uncharacterized protein n=1 Tax=Vitis vinifera TaxID=29760 RepID=A0A438BVY5_VITVI|nr:hypothetical protein CK203_083333 [Vitis vinifera]
MVLQRCKKPVWGGGLEGHQKRLGEFSFSFRFIIGDGTRVKFWKDLWCGNQSLEEAFPILFNLSVNKEGWVAEAWEEDEGEVAGGFVLTDTLMIGSSFSRDSKPPSRLELFGRLGFQLGLVSLVGRRLGIGCSPDRLKRLVGASPTDAFCVNIRRKPQITFYCFVRKPECYGS